MDTLEDFKTPDGLRQLICDHDPQNDLPWKDRLEFLPKEAVRRVLTLSLAAKPEEEIVTDTPYAGNDFDYSAVLQDLANLATLYCAVIVFLETRTKKEPSEKTNVTEAEVLEALPRRQRGKREARLVTRTVLSKIKERPEHREGGSR